MTNVLLLVSSFRYCLAAYYSQTFFFLAVFFLIKLFRSLSHTRTQNTIWCSHCTVFYDCTFHAAVRKMKFFLHPDKLPHDLTEQQALLCRTLWDVITEAWDAQTK